VPEGHPVAPVTARLAELIDAAADVAGRGAGRSNDNPFAPGRDLVLAASAPARTPLAGTG
jgi:hypothetical protein